MRKSRSYRRILCMTLVACVSAALLGGCGDKDKKSNEAPPLEKEGYVLDWHDEFEGTELDKTKWLDYNQPHRTEYPEGSKAKYTVKDGVLSLYIDRDSKDFFTGETGGFRVSSIQTYNKNGLHIGETVREVEPFDGYHTKYGYFELRCKRPACEGGGAIAWWMVGIEADSEDGTDSQQNVEIDIFENLYTGKHTNWIKLHPWDDPNLFDQEMPVVLDENIDYVNEWHVYGMDWRPDSLTFYLDGEEIAKFNQAPQYDLMMYLSMYTNDDPNYWAGGAADDIYPKTWEIDYVRVYKDVNGYSE